MKYLRYICIICCLTILFSSCSVLNSQTSDKKLCDIGLELISVMNEMVKSDEYAKLIGGDSSYLSVREDVNTDDYDYPTSVYKISPPNAEELLLKVVDDDDIVYWNDISNNLKKQIENRIGINNIVSVINSSRGTYEIGFSSLYTAIEKDTQFKVKKDTTLLYVFESGTPIIITFSESGIITGQFLFLGDVYTLSDIRDIFGEYECDVKKIK